MQTQGSVLGGRTVDLYNREEKEVAAYLRMVKERKLHLKKKNCLRVWPVSPLLFYSSPRTSNPPLPHFRRSKSPRSTALAQRRVAAKPPKE